MQTSQITRYEHPLTEKVRIYLRLDYLLRQMQHSSNQNDPWQYKIFFNALFDLLEILDQVQVKTDLAKDIDKQRQQLKSWLNIDGVDEYALQQMIDAMEQAHKALISSPRLGQSLREDRFLSSIKQRFSIPGGSCCFDLPSLHHWLHLPDEEKQSAMKAWLSELDELQDALNLWLKLIRETAQYKTHHARNGFFQYDAEDACLLRLEICAEDGVYPMISGHRNRFAIRFSPFTEGEPVASDLEFKLAIC
ncbi:cell division protein ZapD [Photobacterium leiognathi]|uniref:cell division protein ZapD n=1 Tax=Photobacterium leiognathi TaxID=553611 RepID=UPI002982528F|nr:cell division protein ZapD [Photobacterium leiognathi]